MENFLIGLFLIVLIGILVVTFAGLWKVFEKAGEPGWAAIIPIYNLVILLRIVGKPWWWLLLSFIPYVGVIWQIWTSNMLSKSFGKESGFTAGLVFFPFVFVPILGFGDAKYIGPFGDKALYDAYQQSKNGSGFDFENDVLAS